MNIWDDDFPSPEDAKELEREILQIQAESDQNKCHDRDGVLYSMELMSRMIEQEVPGPLIRQQLLNTATLLIRYAKWF